MKPKKSKAEATAKETMGMEPDGNQSIDKENDIQSISEAAVQESGATDNSVQSDAPVEDGAGVISEAAKDEGKAEENVMYVGPTIPNLIRHGVVFAEGKLTERLENAIASYKPMRMMFVKISELPEALKQIKLKTGALATIYKSVAQRIKG